MLFLYLYQINTKTIGNLNLKLVLKGCEIKVLLMWQHYLGKLCDFYNILKLNLFFFQRNLFASFILIKVDHLKMYAMKIKHLLILPVFLLMSFSFLQAQTEIKTNTKKDKDLKLESPIPVGIFNATSIGVLSGSSQNQQSAPFSFLSLMLYQFDENIAAGAGLGIDFLEETYIPLVADFRYYLRGTRFSPFVFAQAGYSFPTQKSANQDIIYAHYDIWPYPYPQAEAVKPKGGFQINPGFGIRHMFHNEFGLEISFAYHYQRLSYQYSSNTRIETDYNRLNLRIGIIFQ